MAAIEISGPGEGEAFRIVYEVPERPAGNVFIGSGESTYDATLGVSVAAGKGWREMVITQDCLPDLSNDLKIEADAAFTLRLDTIVRESMDPATECAF